MIAASRRSPLLIAAILCFFSHSVFAQVEAPRTPHPGFGLPELKAAIESAKATEIEDVATILAKNLKSNFTVIQDSDSPQSGTEKGPRIVFWDEYAGFSASFNGGTPQAESNSIEIMQFDFDSSKFLMLRQTFPLAVSDRGTPVFAPYQPKECRLCHGSDPRPIWSEYPKWPGVLGFDNDFIKEGDQRRYSDFARIAQSHPRYRDLFSENRQASWPTYPYRSETGPQAEFNNSSTLRPNLRLGELLSRLNTARIMRMIRKNPDYGKNIPALLYGFLGCDANGIQKTPEGLLKMAGVSIVDVDPRVSYVTDLSPTLEENPSYFDGSGSMNELISNEIFKDAIQGDATYAGVYSPNRLRVKYRFKTQANLMDTQFNDRMDELGQWIPTPYRPEETETKHRQQFSAFFREDWQKACDFVKARSSREQLLQLQRPITPRLRAETREIKKDAFGYYGVYCAKCHTGADSVDLFIRNSSDMKNYRDLDGQSLLDKIRLGIMPKGLRSLSDGARSQWEQDKPKFIEELEKAE